VPGGDGEYDDILRSSFDPTPHVNSVGQVAFYSELGNTQGGAFDGSLALFLTSPQGTIHEVVRTGQLFDIDPSPAEDLRTIFAIDEWELGTGGQDGQLSCLSDTGILVFALRFTDQSEGLFTITVPESTTISLFAVGFFAQLLHTRAKKV